MKASEFNKRRKIIDLDDFGSVFALKSIDYNGNSFISSVIMSTGFNKPIKEQYRVIDSIRRNFIYYLIDNNILEETYKGAYEFLGSRDVDVFGKNFKFDLDSLIKNSRGYVDFSPLLFEPLIDVFGMTYHIFEYDKNKKFIYKTSGGHNNNKNIIMLHKDDKLVHHDLLEFKLGDTYKNILNMNELESFLRAIDKL